MSRRGRLVAASVLLPLALFLVASLVLNALLRAPLPKQNGRGAEADALAREVAARVDQDAWRRTGAVEWTFRHSREHLWDRRRRLARVRADGLEVLMSLETRRGLAWRGAERLDGQDRARALERAYALWTNDSFWLNPLGGLFDPGVDRSLVPIPPGDPGAKALLVTYGSGGVTPGDSYLWLLDDTGLPVAWRMWTSAFPIQGIRVTWEDWTALPTGAWVSRTHHLPAVRIELTGVRAAATLAELTGGRDPFAPLLEPPPDEPSAPPP